MKAKRAIILAMSALVACGPADSGGEAGGRTARDSGPAVFFPTTKDQNAYMQALGIGTLVEDAGCVFLESGGFTSLILWPEGYSADRGADGAIDIRDESGAVLARTGQSVEMSGGFVSEARHETGFAERMIEEPIPDRCKADGYWAAGPGVTVRASSG